MFRSEYLIICSGTALWIRSLCDCVNVQESKHENAATSHTRQTNRGQQFLTAYLARNSSHDGCASKYRDRVSSLGTNTILTLVQHCKEATSGWDAEA